MEGVCAHNGKMHEKDLMIFSIYPQPLARGIETSLYLKKKKKSWLFSQNTGQLFFQTPLMYVFSCDDP